MHAEKLTVLCVDDEPRVLEALERHLRERYQVLTAGNGAAALDLLGRRCDIAMILSDMRMPQMDGAAFFAAARSVRPNAIRILLTGHSDIEAAARAINEGQIFRFITKPCAPDRLEQVLVDARRQYEMSLAEKTLLQRTMLGCIRSLVDAVALANPAALGRTPRLERRVSSIAAELELERSWEVQAAALLSELGALSLSPELLDKLDTSGPLSETERSRVRDAMRSANELIARVPRLGPVSRLLNLAGGFETRHEADELERTHLELLELAAQLDDLEAAGSTPTAAVTTAAAGNKYPGRLLEAARLCAEREAQSFARAELGFMGLRLGMILAEDLRNARGVLIAPRGSEVTAGFLEKMRNFVKQSEGVKFSVRIPHSAPHTTPGRSRP